MQGLFSELFALLVWFFLWGKTGLCQHDELPLPTVNLGGDPATAVETFRNAALDHGFFLVTNHSIDESLIDQTVSVMRQMFDLPANVKSKYLNAEHYFGYTEFGNEKLDSVNQTVGGTKESWYIAANNDGAYKQTLFPDNQDSQGQTEQWKQTVYQYFDAMIDVANRLTSIIALSLDLTSTYFDSCLKVDPMAVLRLIRYANVDSFESKGEFGCGAHSDWGFITLLLTRGHGLQIEHNGVWKNVPSLLDGTFVVNIADELQRWTNDEYRSTKHRVITHQSQQGSRYSIAFFFEPRADCTISKLPTIRGPAKYPPITHREYYEHKMHNTHAGYGTHSEL